LTFIREPFATQFSHYKAEVIPMKSAASVTLIIGLAAAPLTALDLIDPTGAPIARAITTEASRLAAARPSPPSHGDWSRLQALESGTEIIVTVKGSSREQCAFVRVDESALWIRSFDRNRSVVPLDRADVVVVRQAARPGRPQRGALIGLVIGSAMPIVYAANYRCGGDCQITAGHFVVFGGLGAGLGALLGEAIHQPERTIYRAP
jgi:hypothetical protein